MALNLNNNTAAPTNAQNEAWKADGYINFNFQLEDGSSFKIDALALKASRSKAMEKLVAFLDQNPDKVDQVINRCVVTYRSAKKNEADVDLGLG